MTVRSLYLNILKVKIGILFFLQTTDTHNALIQNIYKKLISKKDGMALKVKLKNEKLKIFLAQIIKLFWGIAKHIVWG